MKARETEAPANTARRAIARRKEKVDVFFKVINSSKVDSFLFRDVPKAYFSSRSES